MGQIEQPPEPWRSFFADVDALLTHDVYLHCCGGFVVTQLYGVARTTSDIDFLAVVPNVQRLLTEIAGRDSPLHRKHKLYLDAVTVATPPEDCPSLDGIMNGIATTSSNSRAPDTCRPGH